MNYIRFIFLVTLGHSALSQSRVGQQEPQQVLYGDRIKLINFGSSCALSSHELNYTSGSNSQEILCNSIWEQGGIWIVEEPTESTGSLAGTPVLFGMPFVLQHVETGVYLRMDSRYPSPYTREAEVNGSNELSGLNNWSASLFNPLIKQSAWTYNQKVLISNDSARKYLRTNFQIFLRPNQQELSGNAPVYNRFGVWVALRS